MPDPCKRSEEYTLFGGDIGWNSRDWTSSDDSVRGGRSESHLDLSNPSYARFYGNLDIDTLGGAGFASQRTTGDDRSWNFSEYVGIQIDVHSGDKKRYTIILKDTLPESDNRALREQSTLSWECDFDLPPQTEPGHAHDKTIFIPWKSLNPTYRGKVQKDVRPLDLKSIKRFSIMMRSYFGTQKGDFSLSIKKISAVTKVPPPSSTLIKVDTKTQKPGPTSAIADNSVPDVADPAKLEKGGVEPPEPRAGAHRAGSSPSRRCGLWAYRASYALGVFALVMLSYRIFRSLHCI